MWRAPVGCLPLFFEKNGTNLCKRAPLFSLLSQQQQKLFIPLPPLSPSLSCKREKFSTLLKQERREGGKIFSLFEEREKEGVVVFEREKKREERRERREREERERGWKEKGILGVGSLFFYSFVSFGSVLAEEKNEKKKRKKNKENKERQLLKMDIISEVDKCYSKGKLMEGFSLASNYLNLVPNHYEVGWRVSRFSYLVSKKLSPEMESRKIHEVLEKGVEVGEEAVKYDPECPKGHKWLGICLMSLASLEWLSSWAPLMERSKEHLEKTVELAPRDGQGHFFLGKWHWEVYSSTGFFPTIFSWLFWVSPPSFSLSSALEHFLEAEGRFSEQKDFEMENILLIGKTYLALGEKEDALHWFRYALISKVRSKDDLGLQDEAREFVRSLGG